MLKLKLQYFSHPMQRTDSLEKTLMLGKIEGGRRRGWQRMRWLDGHEFEQALEDGEGQGSLACCSPWGHKESDTTQQLNSSVQFIHSVVSDSLWPMNPARQASLSITNCQSLPKPMSTESVMPSKHLLLCRSLLLLSSVFPSIKVFPSESALCIRWPKYWSFSISPSNEYSGLISSRTDWFDPLAIQWTLESSRAPQVLRRELKRVLSPLLQCWVLATATLSWGESRNVNCHSLKCHRPQ